MAERVRGRGNAQETPLGLSPGPNGLHLEGLDIPSETETVRELLCVDRDEWRRELPDIEAHFAQFGEHLPGALRQQLGALRSNLDRSA
jgi:phosphoenolpyruvate carboxykinase (GTP)